MADIRHLLDKIRKAIYGKEVRGSLADGLEAVNNEAEDATEVAVNVEQRQDAVEQQFNTLLGEWSDDKPIDNAETIAARTNTKESKTYENLGKRLDEEYGKVTSQLAHTEQKIGDTGNFREWQDSVIEKMKTEFGERGYNLAWNSLLVDNGDWTSALQKALDDSPDTGRIIIIPNKIRIDGTIIFPLVDGSESELKPITIKGYSSTRNTGVLNQALEGLSAIEYTGDGYLFDYRLGEEAETRSTVSLIDIALHGNNKDGTRAINADRITGSRYSNVLIRNFDEGFVVNGSLYYSSMENIKCFYNKTVGMHIKSYINGTKLEKCSFSNTKGTGLLIDFGGVAALLDSCWFESNGIGLRTTNVDQLNLFNCYFERNDITMQVAAHTTSGSTLVNLTGGHYDIREDAARGFHVTGKVDFTMNGPRINWGLPNTVPLISTYTSREGLPTLITINSKFTNKPINLLQNGTVIMDIDSKRVSINKEIALQEIYAKLIELQENISFATDKGLNWGHSDASTTAKIADFPHLVNSDGIASMFRDTNTSGGLLFDIKRGDGTNSYAHRFNAKTGDLFMRGKLGVGNSEVGDVTESSKIRKVEVFDTFGASLGYIQIYSG